MQLAAKIRLVTGVFLAVMISACTGPLGQQAATGGGTGTAGSGTGTAESGSNSQHASTNPTPSPSNSSGITEPGTQNAVQLGASFNCTGGYCFFFGSVIPGGSIQRQLGISANGARSATVVAISTESDEFVLTSDNCTGHVLDPGSSCTISVTFRPTANGLRTASLSVSADPSELSSGTTLGGFGGPPGFAGPSTHGTPPTQLAPTDGPSTPSGESPTPSGESPTPSAAPSTPSGQSS
jgi:Abnormal spindle-like microcephaly-assoc'd, ASPM-SPD-2-Hydin